MPSWPQFAGPGCRHRRRRGARDPDLQAGDLPVRAQPEVAFLRFVPGEVDGSAVLGDRHRRVDPTPVSGISISSILPPAPDSEMDARAVFPGHRDVPLVRPRHARAGGAWAVAASVSPSVGLRDRGDLLDRPRSGTTRGDGHSRLRIEGDRRGVAGGSQRGAAGDIGRPRPRWSRCRRVVVPRSAPRRERRPRPRGLVPERAMYVAGGQSRPHAERVATEVIRQRSPVRSATRTSGRVPATV